MVAGLAALLTAKPATADVGAPARIFHRSDLPESQTIKGQGYKLEVPSNWIVSDQVETKNQIIRYEDSGNISASVIVVKEPTSSQSIDQVGDPDSVLKKYVPILGKQSFDRPTDAEGGFKSGAVAALSVLDQTTMTDKSGNKYYGYELLLRTADGTEGGRHVLMKAGVKGGNIYLMKVEAGDKRWVRDKRASCRLAMETFQVV